MAIKGKRLTYADRRIIEQSLKEGKSVISIASNIGCTRQAIYLELKRCVPYSADEAQKKLFI